jgi:hypothetical protein
VEKPVIFKYYGVDWVIFAFVVIHLWMLGNKKRQAFLFGMGGNLFGILLGYLVESIACIIMNSVFLTMHINAYRKWGSK